MAASNHDLWLIYWAHPTSLREKGQGQTGQELRAQKSQAELSRLQRTPQRLLALASCIEVWNVLQAEFGTLCDELTHANCSGTCVLPQGPGATIFRKQVPNSCRGVQFPQEGWARPI